MKRAVSFFRNLPIRYKLLLGYSGVLLLFTVFGGAVMYTLVRNTVATGIQSELEANTRNILGMVRSAAQVSIRNRLRAIAETNYQLVNHYYRQYTRGEISGQQARDLAESLLLDQRVGRSGYIYCLNSNGVVVVHPKPGMEQQNVSEYQFVQAQMRRKNGYLEYDWKNPGEVEARPKALYMIYFKPWDWIISVSSYRREFRELINVDDFREQILALRLGESGYSFILNGKGDVIVHPYSKGNFKNARDAHGKPVFREISENKTGIIEYTWKNPGETEYRDRIAAYSYIPEYDWIVVSVSYRDEVFAPLNSVRNIFLVIFIVSLLPLIWLSWRISRSITLPIEQLQRRFAAGAAGDLSVRLPTQRGDEIGRLSRYFNDFMSRLEDEHRLREQAQSEQREMSEQLRQVQKMKAIGQLAGGIAHDFNNLLTAILGSAELMMLKSKGEFKEQLENIIQASTRAAALTRNLLDFSRKGTLQHLPVDVHKMLDDVIELLSHSIDKRITITKDYQSVSAVISGDPSRLQNAFLNLGINARDAMPEGGKLIFGTGDIVMENERAFRSGILPPGRYLKVSVEDSGIGISNDKLEHIFEPFYTTKEHGKGTGLGLASVYGCVKIHEGAVDLHSIPGTGTCFEIYLPQTGLELSVENDKRSGGIAKSTGYILVIDDEDIVRGYMVSALQELGYQTSDFADPQKAVEFFSLQHDKINLVILDLVMPGMNGRETLGRLLAVDAKIPVIILSGYSERQEGDLLTEGACHFVRKPVQMDELSEVIIRFKRQTSDTESG